MTFQVRRYNFIVDLFINESKKERKIQSVSFSGLHRINHVRRTKKFFMQNHTLTSSNKKSETRHLLV